MGRKRKKTNLPRDDQFAVRVTDAEYTQIARLARMRGKSIASYVRDILLQDWEKRKADVIAFERAIVNDR
jgi:hypothetical protein